MTGAPAVEWRLLDHAADSPVNVGDLVSRDAGGMPIYWVMAVENGRALLRSEDEGLQRLPLATFRWRGAARG